MRTNKNFGQPSSQEAEEDKIAGAIRQLRQAWLAYLEKKVRPDNFQDIAGDAAKLADVMEDDRLELNLQSLATDEIGDPLLDLLGQVLKCERDPWEGHIICGGPKALEAALHDQRLQADWMLLVDLKGDRPGDCAFLLLYHQEHWVPSWAPEYFGPFSSRPWIELPSVEGFAEPFMEACNKHNWNLDLTYRAAGDCLWHPAVIFHIFPWSQGANPMSL